MYAEVRFGRLFSAWGLACTIIIITSILSTSSFAEDKPPDSPKADTAKEKDGDKKSDEAPAKKPKIKKYDEVITKDAVSKTGLFRVHRLDDSLYYEIPADALDTDLLWVVQISETTAGSSYAGMPVTDRVVRW